VGAIVLALWPRFDGGDPPTIGGRSTDGDRIEVATGAGGEAITRRVELEEGWTIPADIDGLDDAADEGIADGAGLPAGAATYGASVDVVAAAATFVVHADAPTALAYRTGSGDRWDPWRSLLIGGHEAPDGLPGEEGEGGPPPASAPVLLPAGASLVEFVVTGGDARPFDVVFLPSFDRPVDPEFDGPAGPSASVGGDAPAIIPREAWADRTWNHQNGSCDEGPQISDHLQALVVHHTVTGNDYSESQVDDLLRSILYSHTVINGWCDIGYNFVVDRFGRIWEARTGSIDDAVIGGHARGFNRATMGVALLGQHHAGAWPRAAGVPRAAAEAVEVLANWKLGAEGVDPDGRTFLRNRSSAARQRLAGETWHHVPTVLGHRDLGLTSCPGSHGMELVAALPDRLSARRHSGLPYAWTDWRAHDHGPGLVVADARGGLRPAGAAEPWSQAPGDLGGDGPVVAVGGDLSGGYLLTAGGRVVGYGAAPSVASPVVVGGAVDLVVRGDGMSGWVLDGRGVLRGFGGAPDLQPSTAVSQPVAAAIGDDGRGYILEGNGRLVPLGGAPRSAVSLSVGSAAVDLDLDAPDAGWVLDASGKLSGFGGRADRRVDALAPVVAVVAAEQEAGGWVVDRHGQLWPFGGARYVFPVSTSARAGDIVDADRVGLVYGAEFLAGGDARYLQRIHRLFLGRDATEAEVDLGAAGLEQGADRIDLTLPLARSDQWAGANLDRMYLDVLGREPDPEGRAYWMGEIGRGLKLQDLGTYFYGSAEYAKAAGTDETYIRGLYSVLLHRAPDEAGLAYWVEELASGRAQPPDVAAGFYASVESRRDRVTRLHQRILGTSPTRDRRDAWVERLPDLGDVGLAAEIAASSEFHRLAVDGPEP
jgi:hypothetical protein